VTDCKQTTALIKFIALIIHLFTFGKKSFLHLGIWLIGVSLLAACQPLLAQESTSGVDSLESQLNRKRLRLLTIGGSATYGVALLGLNQLWYANNPRSSFRFFNDNAEWQQIDKVGHLYTAFHLSRLGTEAFRWTGMPAKKAALWGSLTGVILLTPIEILDGFSAAYGASWGDEVANLSGSALFLGQYLLWDEIRVMPKFSFHRSGLAPLRPNTLGNGLQEEFLKDYNGQTYWLSLNLHAFMKKQSRFPQWLNVAIGYGGQDMIYARREQNLANGYDAYRQFYLSLDLSTARIKTRSKAVKALLFALDAIKIPAPTLEWNPRSGWKFHPLYF
jgi:uncharacterized protein YfiM (DUF2279 family)